MAPTDEYKEKTIHTHKTNIIRMKPNIFEETLWLYWTGPIIPVVQKRAHTDIYILNERLDEFESWWKQRFDLVDLWRLPK